MAGAGRDQFEFEIISDFVGYVTTKDKTDTAANVLVRGSKNVIKKDSGTIAVRDGLKRRGVADSAAQGVAASYEWSTSWGATRVLRVLDDTTAGGDGKLQVEYYDGSNYQWADLQTALSLTRYIFSPWWNDSAKKDKLIMVRGDDNLYSWEGGLGLITGTTVNTITLDVAPATNGFINAGNVIINGTTYAYTGISGNDLTGVTADPTGEAIGSAVVSEVVTNTDSPAANFANDFIITVGNQIVVGSYVDRRVFLSSSTNFTNFTVPSPRAAGDPEMLVLDNNPTGFAVRQGNLHISAGLSDWYVVSYTDIAVGTDLTQQTVVDKQQTAALSAAKAQEFIDTVGDNIVYMDQNNQIRLYGIARNIVTAVYPSISQQIRLELESLDFTGGALRAIGELIYITCPLNGSVYIHETRETIDGNGNVIAERLWHPPQIWVASRVALIGGETYVHSTANPQLYQTWNTMQYQDDSPSDEPMPYDAVVRWAYQNTDRRQGMTTLSKIYVEGYMTPGTNLNAYLLSDYQGASGSQNPNVNSIASPADFFIGANAPSLGDYSLGDNPLGDGLTDEENDQEQLPKFRAILDVSQINCFEYQVIFYSYDIGSRWEILAWGTNAVITGNQQAGFLTKT